MFPDVVALVVSSLALEVDVPVVSRIPNPRPAEFIRVSRVGGTRRNQVTDAGLVVVEAWATSEADAADLGEAARSLVHSLEQTTVGGYWVRRVREIGGLQSYPDGPTNTPRYQFTAQIDTRGRAA